ncbi:metalloregulator ArsR/SmtB family transcription factor [Vineibacter terrae]|uniref:ArsR/SmtB family transcription factor n=1 Tax=Vineibacter terrae TaxID=2586908 RepID=UPI002E30F776|nr:metalloregulator ArsR/SmtB family transcription factor [Vineibacter terrae]HEX2888463.1 metalloregulator ArsR/SmtB family transcription factor [Vineibacter terrae]
MLEGVDRKQFERSAANAAQLLKALANQRRLMVLCALANGERSVGALAAEVGLGQSALSQHLARLRGLGIVAARRDAQSIYYRVADPAAARLLETLAAIFCPPPQAANGPRASRRARGLSTKARSAAGAARSS